MRGLTLKDAARIMFGEFSGNEALLDKELSGVSIDSRTVKSGELYVAVRGDRFDGHSFAAAAVDAGALAAVSDTPLGETPHILVRDTVEALQMLAAYYRRMFDIPVVGITGSVGKTTTKEMIARVLAEGFNVLRSKGNLNNQTGVPQTVFALSPEHTAAVIEMGTNHFGEIDRLAAMVRPTVGVLTNIGEAHIEHLGSKMGILRAKCEMLRYIKKGGYVVVNGDDPYLAPLKDKRANVITFGTGEGCDFRAEDIENKGLSGSSYRLKHGDESIPINVPAPGAHMILNSLCAAAVGCTLGMKLCDTAKGIAAFKPAVGRGDVRENGRITVLNETYNANPKSMRAALDVLRLAKGRRVAILGDMLELGQESAAYHEEIGRYAALSGAELILCVGELARSIYAGANAVAPGCARHYESKAELEAALSVLISEGDSIMVKASNGMKLADTVEALMKL